MDSLRSPTVDYHCTDECCKDSCSKNNELKVTQNITGCLKTCKCCFFIRLESCSAALVFLFQHFVYEQSYTNTETKIRKSIKKNTNRVYYHLDKEIAYYTVVLVYCCISEWNCIFIQPFFFFFFFYIDCMRKWHRYFMLVWTGLNAEK